MGFEHISSILSRTMNEPFKKKESFFDQLFRYSEGFIEFRVLPSGKRQFFMLKHQERMNQFQKQNRNSNLFFGIATRDGGGGTKENIIHIPALWCDADFKDTDRNQLYENLSQFPYAPSIIVSSGGGAHFYWILKEPAEKPDIECIEEINRRIAEQLNGDPNACDAARICVSQGLQIINTDHPVTAR